MLLIDSSAIVKFFSKEPGWENMGENISRSVTIQLAMVELSSALLKKVMQKEMSIEKAIEYVTRYGDNAVLLDQRSYTEAAFKIAVGRNISIYDSFFIAAAIAEGYDLVSCDQRQIRAAKSLGVKVIEC